jgi:hypothetical protein
MGFGRSNRRYIVFRGSDIKDLQVISAAPPADPAIIHHQQMQQPAFMQQPQMNQQYLGQQQMAYQQQQYWQQQQQQQQQYQQYQQPQAPITPASGLDLPKSGGSMAMNGVQINEQHARNIPTLAPIPAASTPQQFKTPGISSMMFLTLREKYCTKAKCIQTSECSGSCPAATTAADKTKWSSFIRSLGTKISQKTSWWNFPFCRQAAIEWFD